MELIIENIRCFAGRHTIPIKPLTFLTGGNSSGKSTFLAVLASTNDFGFPLRPRFNEPPYNLGNYDTIATYKGGRYGRATQFSLGYRGGAEPTMPQSATEIVATYKDKQGAVEISSVTARNGFLSATLTFATKGAKILVDADVIEGEREYHFSSDIDSTTKFSTVDVADVLYLAFLRDNRRVSSQDQQYIYRVYDLFFNVTGINTISIAPVRTKPKRTYDQLTEEFTPEGEHIPFVLVGVLDNPDTKFALERFGRESGLFQRISVKKLGNKISDPVQVMVSNSSRPANLQDVGYGVSQALPIVVESVLGAPSQLLLLQQPEVHLHPRAQAALGSLFVDLHRHNNKQFVVETHSDYIIDRVRQEIARGQIAADDVQILFFDNEGSETRVFPIAIDEQGNIVNPPPSYRDFFMEEEMNLLSRGRS